VIYNVTGTVLFALTLLSTFIIKDLSIESTGLDTSGIQLFAYNLSRLYLVLALAISFYSMGCITLGLIENRPSFLAPKLHWNVLTAFFLGASIIGFIFAVLGLFGLLQKEVALLTIAPLLYVSPRYLLPKFNETFKSITLGMKESSVLELTIRILLCWYLIIGVSWGVLLNGLYPLAGDGDVWTHYIHFQRSVISSGTTLPGELWYHFYLSKGAGLNFFAGLLSDGLAGQTVSIIFYIITTYTVFAIASAAGVGINLSILSGIIFITIFDGQFYKHHVVVTSYIAFLFWISVFLLKEEYAARNRILLVSGILSSAYLGFFQPLQASIIFVFFGLLSVFAILLKYLRKSAIRILLLTLATALGAFISITLNYFITGLVEHVPLGLTWPIANIDKFKQVFGSLGISFFLLEQVNLKPFESSYIDWNWLINSFRISKITQMISFEIFSIFCFFVIFSFKRNIFQRQFYSISYVIISGFTLIVPAVYLASNLQTPSIYRILTFSSVILSIALVLPFHLLINGSGYGILRKTLCRLFPLFISSWFIFYFIDAQPKIRSKQIEQFLFGKVSLLSAMLREPIETSNYNLNSLYSSVRNALGGNVRIWSLVQPSDPSMAFPAPGIMSEPSYDLGPDHLDIVMGEAEKSVELLKRHDINYFLLPLGGDTFTPFSSLLLSNLFAPANVQKYFKIQEKSGLNYILTWRIEGQDPLSKELLHLLDFYRNDTIDYFFSKNSGFDNNIKSIINKNLDLYSHESIEFKKSVMADIRQLLLGKLGSSTEYPPNHKLMYDIFEQVFVDVSNYITKLNTEADTSKISVKILDIIRADIKNRIILLFGPEAVHLTIKSARVPYGSIIDDDLKLK
jgi:hypothetical protein